MRKKTYHLFSILAVLCMLSLLTAMAGVPAAPRAPSDLTLRIHGDEGFLLTWKPSPDDPGGVTGYEIARAELAGGPFETVVSVSYGVLTYHDTTAKREIIYFYKVRATAGKVASPYSNTVTGERAGSF
jgi:hypothetical protein